VSIGCQGDEDPTLSVQNKLIVSEFGCSLSRKRIRFLFNRNCFRNQQQIFKLTGEQNEQIRQIRK
jgi:hypothetical protein